eukprot:1040568-Alexandrium_andersonii.AAC.1
MCSPSTRPSPTSPGSGARSACSSSGRPSASPSTLAQSATSTCPRPWATKRRRTRRFTPCGSSTSRI